MIHISNLQIRGHLYNEKVAGHNVSIFRGSTGSSIFLQLQIVTHIMISDDGYHLMPYTTRVKKIKRGCRDAIEVLASANKPYIIIASFVLTSDETTKIVNKDYVSYNRVVTSIRLQLLTVALQVSVRIPVGQATL